MSFRSVDDWDPVAAELVRSRLVNTYLATATLALVLYEHIITFDAEHRYIRKASWSLPKLAFLLNRYFILILAFITAIELFRPASSHPLCKYGLQFSALGSLVVSSIVDFSLLLRLHAFWNRSRRILFSISAIYCLCVTTGFIGVALSFRHASALAHFTDTAVLPVCVQGHGGPLWAVVLPTVVFDTVVVILTAIRARQVADTEHTPLIMHLYCTGVEYYLVALACNVALAFLLAQRTPLATPLPSALASITCTRMLLSIRAQVERCSSAPEIPASELRRVSDESVTIVVSPSLPVAV